MNRIALVTGASRGIGRAISVNLARKGFRVACGFNANANGSRLLVNQLESEGYKAMAVRLSVENRLSVVEALNIVGNQWGNVDILVNNAAIAQEKLFDAITDQDWDAMMAVNLRGPFICAQECLPQMIHQGWGRIINITSIGGQWGGFNQVHYAASKAGLINLTRSLAKLYSKHGVTSNAVAVGLVKTDMSAAELETEAGKSKVKAIPRGRVGTLQDIADTVAFLASDQADYITGQTINLNGGMYFG